MYGHGPQHILTHSLQALIESDPWQVRACGECEDGGE